MTQAESKRADAKELTVVGAGLSGPLMAIYLAKAGYRVRLFEKRPDPRAGDAEAGRSINLALSTRGLKALAEVGVEEAVLATVTPMKGRMMHSTDGTTTYQPYGTEAHQVINSVSRIGLNMLLLDKAEEYDNVEMVFDRTCVNADIDDGNLSMRNNASGAIEVFEAPHVVAADGAFSVVRGAMLIRPHFNYDQYYLEHGYKELCIPAGPNGEHQLRADSLHIWPRGNFMMIALANQDGSFTCTLFWPFDGPNSFNALKDRGEIKAFFEKMFPDAVPLMPGLVDEYLENATSSLVTIRCAPWYYKDRAVLIGDAAHAVVPFYGQGMNCSFEDCHLLAKAIEQNDGDLARAFKAYGDHRKPDGDAIRDLAIENFIEMRDLVTSKWFLFKKALGKLAHRVAPKLFVPLYSMVTFSDVPYAEARARAARQTRIAQWIAGVLGVLLVVAIVWWLT